MLKPPPTSSSSLRARRARALLRAHARARAPQTLRRTRSSLTAPKSTYADDEGNDLRDRLPDRHRHRPRRLGPRRHARRDRTLRRRRPERAHHARLPRLQHRQHARPLHHHARRSLAPATSPPSTSTPTTSGTLTDADTRDHHRLDASRRASRRAPASTCSPSSTTNASRARHATHHRPHRALERLALRQRHGRRTTARSSTRSANARRLTDPTNPALPPLKLVNNQSAPRPRPARRSTTRSAFRNNGDGDARNVRIADDLPAGLEYVAGSLRLDARALTDADDTDEGHAASLRRLEVLLAEVAPAEIVTLIFRARVTAEIAPGTGAVNTASVAPKTPTASALRPPSPSSTPSALVYAGRSGGATTIAGARVSLLQRPRRLARCSPSPNSGFTPNETNDNPFMTRAGRPFGFALTPEQRRHAATPGVITSTSPRPAIAAHDRVDDSSRRRAGLYPCTVRALDEPAHRRGRRLRRSPNDESRARQSRERRPQHSDLRDCDA